MAECRWVGQKPYQPAELFTVRVEEGNGSAAKENSDGYGESSSLIPIIKIK